MKKTLLAFSLSLMPLFILNAQTDRRVILVIIDGARYSETLGDTLGRYVPRMRKLAQQGVVVDTMVNDSITVTMRAIPAIWCGSWSIPHDTTVNGLSNQYATVPTVWEYFRKARGVDSTHALYIMKWLTTPWIQSFYPQYGPAYWPWYVLQGSTDLDVWQNARTKLQTFHPELAVIYLPDVDSSPSRGWSAYTQAIVTADSIVGMLWDYVQSDPVYQNKTTLLVTNDHGRHLDGVQNGFLSHGDGCWGCRHIMFLGVGAGVPKGVRTSIRRTIPDITPTIGSLLGFPTPYATGKSMMEILTSVGTESQIDLLPVTVRLAQNYPNPFNPSTAISFRLPAGARSAQVEASAKAGLPAPSARQTASGLGVEGSADSWVNLRIFDILGRQVTTLVSGSRPAGAHVVQWDGNDERGERVPSGVYLYQLTVGSSKVTKKMILLK